VQAFRGCLSCERRISNTGLEDSGQGLSDIIQDELLSDMPHFAMTPRMHVI